MADPIPLIEPVVGKEELENVREVIETGYMTQGPMSQEFEEMFAEFVEADCAIAATSCTTGMELALESIGVGDGDEVIVPDFTHPASANAVVRADADPVLVDVDRDTYNIDPDEVATAVTEDTAGLLPVSWGGQPLSPDPLRDIADEHDLAIVEDAACAAGATYDGEPAGSQFDASVFSFHPRKVLTTGEGGIVTTDNAELEETMRRIKNFGTNPRTDVGFVRAEATNFRFSDVLAAIGVAQLEKRGEIIGRRRELAARYDDLVADVEGVDPPMEKDQGRHTYQSYCVYIETGNEDTRDKLIETLAEEDIETQIGTYALHNTEAFANAKQEGDLRTSDALETNLLTLPIAHSMSEVDQKRVVGALDDALDPYR